MTGVKEIHIRQANSEDLPALVALYEQLEDLGETWSGVRFSAEDIRLSEKAFYSLSQYPDYRIYVAQVKKELVGALALLIMDSVANGVPTGIVESLVVSRSRRRIGVGRQLLTFAIDQCRSKGCCDLTLSGRFANQEAHQFYEKIGFARKGFTFSVKTLP